MVCIHFLFCLMINSSKLNPICMTEIGTINLQQKQAVAVAVAE